MQGLSGGLLDSQGEAKERETSTASSPQLVHLSQAVGIFRVSACRISRVRVSTSEIYRHARSRYVSLSLVRACWGEFP